MYGAGAPLKPGPTRAVASVSSVALEATGDVLAGFTSQHWPVFLRISKDSRALVVAAVGVDLKCTSGIQFSVEDEYLGVPIAANGKLRAGYVVPPTQVSGGSVAGSSSLTGTLNHRHSKLSGTWQLHMSFVLPSGTSDECSSGIVRFTALQ
jgi:hypothetical protein